MLSESGQETRIMHIDFIAAFDIASHQGILYKLCSVGIWGSLICLFTQFLSNWTQHIVVGGCRSKPINIVFGVPQSSVLGPLLFLLCTSELFYILKNVVLQCGARLPIHTLNYLTSGAWPVSGARFLTWGVFECDIPHRRSVAVLCMIYKIRCNPIHPLYGALPVPYVPGPAHAVLWSHIGILTRLLTAEPCSTTGPLFPSKCTWGTILLTL